MVTTISKSIRILRESLDGVVAINCHYSQKAVQYSLNFKMYNDYDK